MSSTSPSAWMLSVTLHVIVAALVAIFTYAASLHTEKPPPILELVAGEGDNFMAREAPALGNPAAEGVTVELPEPVVVKPAPPEPEPSPVVPVPPAPPEPKPAEPVVPNFKKQLVREVIKAESRAKRDIAKERAAAKKRLEEEQKRKKLEEAKKRISKEEYDRMNKAKATPTPKSAPVKVAKIDAEGIAKGVVGGSKANKTGGAGGKALTSDNEDVLAAYFALFKQRLRSEFEPPPGLSDSLKATIEVRSHPDGSLTNARVLRSSGSADFDEAVLAALKRVRMPLRPDRKTETVEFIFAMRERDER